MVMSIMGYAIFVLGYALTFLLIAFGIWVYRKIELRSLPWALAYLILGIVYGIVFFSFVEPQFSILSSHVSHAKDFTTYMLSDRTWVSTNQLLLAILLLADCVIVITKAGGNLTGKFVRFWRWVSDKSTFIGCILIASVVLRMIFWVVWWRAV